MAENDLNVKLMETEAATEKARADVAIVERKIAEAQAVVNGAAKRRQEHALAAATGDTKASAALTKIKRETVEAEQDLADLQAALPEARRRAAAADQALVSIRVANNRAAMMALARKRIELAKEIDRRNTEQDAAWQRFFDLGHEIEGAYAEMMAERGMGHSMANLEALQGVQRLIDAMPRMLRRFFPSEPRLPAHPKPLAPAEASFWALPLDEDNTDGAAAA